MENLYDVLGIPKGASKSDIKRAYFKMIKIYSPEKDPERFKVIRNAYERLYDDNLREEYNKTLNVSSEFSNEFLICKEYINNLQYKKAVDLLLTLRKSHKDEIDIEMTLAEVYLSLGNSTKAINVMEPMCIKYKDNAELSGLLARCYEERGFNKKADAEYKRAISLDETNSKLWTDYINFSDKTGGKELLNLVTKADSIKENMFLENFEIYAIPVIGFKLKNKIEDSIYYLKKYIESYIACTKIDQNRYKAVLSFIFTISDFEEFKHELDKFILILDNYEYKQQEDTEKIKKTKTNLLNLDFFNDEKVNDSLKNLAHVFLHDFAFDNISLDKFFAEFEIISKLPSIRKDILYVKNNYLNIYNLSSSFYNEILNPKKELIIIDKYLGKYKQLRKKYPEYFESDYFDDDYLDDFDFDDEVAVSSSTPYVKDSPKIGRNEPCPCGSGKKYKNCCGRQV